LQINVTVSTRENIGVADGITTIDYVILTSDQAISWRLAAADTAITLDANRLLILWGTSVTAFLISNASGSTANIKVYIGG